MRYTLRGESLYPWDFPPTLKRYLDTMRISEKGIAFIKDSEGFVSHIKDDNGWPAIGHGHRLTNIEIKTKMFEGGINEAQADALLRNDLDTRYEPILRPRIPEGCTQNQYDALCSFVYNIKNQPESLEQLLSHGWDQVPNQIVRWDHVNGKVNGGLFARRQRERALFMS